MSVFLENRRRDSDCEPQADGPPSRAPSFARFLGGARKLPPPASRVNREPLLGLSYDRVEGVVHLVLAFAIVGGAAAIMSSSLFSSGAPVSGAIEKRPEVEAPKVATAVVAPATAVVAPTNEEPEAKPPVVNEMAPVAAPATPVAVPEPPIAAPAPPAAAPKPASAPPAAPSLNPFLDARPMTEAAVPEPLAPPSPDMREKLTGGREETPPSEPATAYQTTAPEPEAKQEAALPKKSAEAPKAAAEDAHTAKCYLKLAGRVQSSGPCTVHHTAEAVTFDLPGKPLEIAHKHGRVWTATLGGRNLGQVYRNKSAPCWGAKGFYACENG